MRTFNPISEPNFMGGYAVASYMLLSWWQSPAPELVIPHLSTRCPQSFFASHLHTCPSFPHWTTPVLCRLIKPPHTHQDLLLSPPSTCLCYHHIKPFPYSCSTTVLFADQPSSFHPVRLCLPVQTVFLPNINLLTTSSKGSFNSNCLCQCVCIRVLSPVVCALNCDSCRLRSASKKK